MKTKPTCLRCDATLVLVVSNYMGLGRVIAEKTFSQPTAEFKPLFRHQTLPTTSAKHFETLQHFQLPVNLETTWGSRNMHH